MDNASEKELFKTLGRIEGKQDQMNERMKNMETSVSDLPCEQHVKDLGEVQKQAVSWRQFVPLLILFTGIVGGIFAYNFHADADHTSNRTIHNDREVIKALKE